MTLVFGSSLRDTLYYLTITLFRFIKVCISTNVRYTSFFRTFYLLMEITLKLRCVLFCQLTVSFSMSELSYKCFSYNDIFFMTLGLRFFWYVCITYGNNVINTFRFCPSLWRIFYYIGIRLFICLMQLRFLWR